jgi:hypothetical protein
MNKKGMMMSITHVIMAFFIGVGLGVGLLYAYQSGMLPF